MQQSISPVLSLYVFIFQTRENTGVTRQRGEGWEEKDRGGVVHKQASLCSHQVHIKIQHLKELWESFQVPAQKQWKVCISAFWGFNVNKDNTVGIPPFYSFFSPKGSIYIILNTCDDNRSLCSLDMDFVL